MLTSFFLDSADVYRPYTVSHSLCVLCLPTIHRFRRYVVSRSKFTQACERVTSPEV